MKYITTINDQEFLVELLDDGRVAINGKVYQIDLAEISEHQVYSLIMDGRSMEAMVYPGDNHWQVVYQGKFYPVRVEDEREHRLRLSSGGDVRERGELQLKSPMPGLIVATPVQEGQHVEKGDVLVVLESMKMQNELKAPRAGVVTRLRVGTGERVEQHTTLLTLT